MKLAIIIPFFSWVLGKAGSAEKKFPHNISRQSGGIKSLKALEVNSGYYQEAQYKAMEISE